MKTLTNFLMLEMKADTYKSAFQKAKAKGDTRADKFLAAYIKALQKETPDADEVAKKITTWTKEDKQQILKMKKSSDDGNNGGFYFYKQYDTKNPNYRYGVYEKFAHFYIGSRDNDQFFYRFYKDLNPYILNYLPNGIFDKVFSDKYSKDNEGNKFTVIDAGEEYHNWYIYFLDDKKLIYVDSKNRAEEKDIRDFVKKTINKIDL